MMLTLMLGLARSIYSLLVLGLNPIQQLLRYFQFKPTKTVHRTPRSVPPPRSFGPFRYLPLPTWIRDPEYEYVFPEANGLQ